MPAGEGPVSAEGPAAAAARGLFTGGLGRSPGSHRALPGTRGRRRAGRRGPEPGAAGAGGGAGLESRGARTARAPPVRAARAGRAAGDAEGRGAALLL